MLFCFRKSMRRIDIRGKRGKYVILLGDKGGKYEELGKEKTDYCGSDEK